MASGDGEPGDGRAGPDGRVRPTSRDRPDSRSRAGPRERTDPRDRPERRPDPGTGAASSTPRRWAGRSLHAGYLRDGDRGRDGSPAGTDCVTVADVVFSLVRDPVDA